MEMIEFYRMFHKIMPQLRSFHFLAERKDNNVESPYL